MSSLINPKIDSSWLKKLENEFSSDYFTELKNTLVNERRTYTIFPPGNEIFRAFDCTPFEKVKAIIIGQDPYHGKGQANGLCFAVKKDIKLPPSLKNIYKELEDDIGIKPTTHGDLTAWALSGVLMLNAVLTVRESSPGSHQNIGWERFTDSIIRKLSNEKENLVFILWGKFAQAKESLIDEKKHLILKAAHPSPFSAHNGFFGCKHFSKTNSFLKEKNIEPINWQIV
ncbi:MAG: uracil-DNA glycosylase [Flavobacteriales bacterium]